MKKKNKRIFRRNVFLIAFLAAMILLGAVIGGVSARYVKDAGQQKAMVRAKEFYFSSDLLKEDLAEYLLNSGTTSITFTLRNHDDQLRYSESPIDYSVLVNDVPYESGTIGNEDEDITVTLSELEDGQTYVVTAIGEAGYSKTLSAEFTVRSQSDGVYKHLERDTSGAFVLLTVWTKNNSGDVTISFPAGLIPDATDDNLKEIRNYQFADADSDGADDDGVEYIGQTNAEAGSLGVYSSYTYRFFLEEPFAYYTVEEFTVVVGDTPADPGIPE